MAQCGLKQRDALYCSFLSDDADVLTYTEGFSEDDGEAGEQIGQQALHGECHASTRDAQAGHQRQQLDSEVLQGHDDEQHRNRRTRHAYYQAAHRRFHLQVKERAFQALRGPSSDQEAHTEDYERGEHFGPELHA
jgi:hypothetical protein